MIARELISSVRSLHKMLSTDSLLTDRAILAELKANALLLIKRESNLRKLWATDSIFTTIPCLEMVEVPISECCEYVDPCSIARSKYKIPRIAEGNYQYVIQGVYSVNIMSGKGKKLKEISVNRYVNLLKLPFVKNEEYFWIVNNYLYVTNPFVKTVRITAFFEEDIPNEIMYPDCNCGQIKVTDEDWCKNPLDKEFALPGYLEKQVLELTSQKLMSTYFGLRGDNTTNNVDEETPLGRPSSRGQTN
jgi:hypothetical protein